MESQEQRREEETNQTQRKFNKNSNQFLNFLYQILLVHVHDLWPIII